MVNGAIFLENFWSNFNFYGFFIGLAVVISWWAMELGLRRFKLQITNFSLLTTIFLLGALSGARLWHVFTSWQNYQNHLIEVLKLWHGGLSIWGGLWGGLIFLLAYFLLARRANFANFWLFLDTLVFGLPLGQAVGRLGNWFNQELYGLPSDLPWAIFIEPKNRLPGFEQVEYYQPLFFYESLGLLLFALVFWHAKKPLMGQGKQFFLYLSYYTFLRFFLEFLRLDKPMLANFDLLSLNQILSVSFWLIFLISFKIYQHR